MYCHSGKNIHFIFNKKKLTKWDKTGTVSRDITMKSLKAQSEESECYIKNAVLGVFNLILDQTPLHLKCQWSAFASVPSCSCKEGDKAGWSRYGPQVT